MTEKVDGNVVVKIECVDLPPEGEGGQVELATEIEDAVIRMLRKKSERYGDDPDLDYLDIIRDDTLVIARLYEVTDA